MEIFLFAALGLALCLLGLAATPPWAMRSIRASMLLAHWRVQLAVTGVSTLFAAALAFLIATSRL